MATKKSEMFTSQEQQMAIIAKALSHPARIAILKVLSERNECICGEIVEVLPLAQSTVSQHLKELKNARLIKGEINGPKSCYCIDWQTMDIIGKEFAALFNVMKQQAKSCC